MGSVRTTVAEDEWGHPFDPYPVQHAFMSAAYDLLQDGGVGIFESPTGTGKSLSLICSTLKWLQDREVRDDGDGGAPVAADKDDVPGWVSDAVDAIKRQHRMHERARAEQQRQQRLKRLRGMPKGLMDSVVPRNRAPGDGSLEDDHSLAGIPGMGAHMEGESVDDDNIHLLQDALDAPTPASLHSAWERVRADSDEEVEAVKDPGGVRGPGCGGNGPGGDDDALQPSACIIYCTRTHSQLAQFVGEIRRTAYAASVATVSLGSRKQLCVHDVVRKLGSASRINDACRSLRESPREGCPFLKADTKDREQMLRDRLLAQPTDLEDLAMLGRRARRCPYYAARSAVSQAQLVMMPYSCLLHEGTREALRVPLAGSVVVLDEAHNLLDAINDAHMVLLSSAQLGAAHVQLGRYLARYEQQLSGHNRLNVKRLIRFVQALGAALRPAEVAAAAWDGGGTGGDVRLSKVCCAGDSGEGRSGSKTVLRCNEFLCRLRIDNINPFELLAFCRRSEIAKKVYGFVEALEGGGTAHASATYGIQSMLNALTSDEEDGRVLVCRSQVPGESFVKYLHLNPQAHFLPIVREARAVLLAGGTMEPVDDVIRALLPPDKAAAVRVHRFGHVVPARNLRAMCVCAASEAGGHLQLVATVRSKPAILEDIIAALGLVRRSTPGGMIIFFPSYSYAAECCEAWGATGALQRELGSPETLFQEPRDAAAAEHMLEDYAAAIADNGVASAPQRATLLSVVGGKMSEGINFADNLGRCVVMVGLPYPNPKDPELVERMAFANLSTAKHVGTTATGGPTPAQRYYEGLCMRAVNQAIGRVIRHVGDYACIVLLDSRYAQPRIIQKLPQWISRSVEVCTTAGIAADRIARFFDEHEDTAS